MNIQQNEYKFEKKGKKSTSMSNAYISGGGGHVVVGKVWQVHGIQHVNICGSDSGLRLTRLLGL